MRKPAGGLVKTRARREAAIAQLNKGSTPADVAVQFKVDIGTVRRWGREAGARDFGEIQAEAMALMAHGMTAFQAAQKLRISTALTAQWLDEKKARDRVAPDSEYQVRRAAELLRGGIEPEFVAKMVKLDLVIVQGLKPSKIAAVDRSSRRGVGALQPLSLTDFTRSDYRVTW